MPLSFHAATIDPISASLNNLRRILAKGKAYADENGIAESEMLSWRLYDDMFDLRSQVGALYLLAIKEGAFLAADLIGSEINPKPKTVAEVDANIGLMLSDLSSIDPVAFEERRMVAVTCVFPIGKMQFETTHKLMFEWAIPNLYFHVATAYDILRNNGVPLGKSDFLGNIGVRPEPLDS